MSKVTKVIETHEAKLLAIALDALMMVAA